MESTSSKSQLFDVYLRLRPAPTSLYPTLTTPERFLSVEESEEELPTHITLNPPNDNRRRAIEKFAFTQVFEEDANQLDIFHGTGVLPLVEGVLGPQGGEGRDGLLATLGVTGSGKSHTILGSRTQRGLTQLALDVLFRSLSNNLLDPATNTSLHATVAASDTSEAQVMPAHMFLDLIYGDASASRASSRAPTPMVGESYAPAPTPRRNMLQRPSVLPHLPDIGSVTVNADQGAEYAIVISMYEVYNDRIFDLLTPALQGKSTKDTRRRALLYKHTELSPDRKVVAGLRKIICGTVKEALMVLDAGLHERRVAGTGSNSVSSRSHGFFCVEIKKRRRGRIGGSGGRWGGSALTIVDLAGSERARDAKTQGTTLQEAGKINESLMYLGQCLQMQGDLGSSTKARQPIFPNLVPFRQCKLTELLFSNSFPSAPSHQQSFLHRNPQKAIMIVTADPLGDFNATSQILRYSALAREITVPRIPSVSSTILAGPGYFSSRGRSSPTDNERETMELAALEIARMSEEIDGLRAELSSEQEKRTEVEAHLESLQEATEGRLLEKEAEIREECFAQMEAMMEAEMRRWKATWAAENDRNDEHLDKKLSILTRATDVGDDEDKENVGLKEDLQSENARLNKEIELLRRDLQGRSPSKKSSSGPLRDITGIGKGIEKLRISGEDVASSPKKLRKLTARKWDLMDGEEVL